MNPSPLLRRTLPGRWLLAALCGVASLLLYLATLTQVHTFDALSYALDVDQKPWQELFHPHHLAYGPLGALVRALAQAVGWQGSAVLPMQLTNALAGALGVALFCLLVQRITERRDLALCGALLLGSSYAYWYYAVEVEVYTIAALFLVVCLGLLVRLLRAPDAGIAAALGLAQGCAVLFHQTNVLLSVPVLLALLLAPLPAVSDEVTAHEGFMRWRMRWLLAYGLPLALLVGGAYLLVGFGISGFASWGPFMAWNTAYARTGWWGGVPDSENWAELVTGLSSALAHPAGLLVGLLLLGLVLLFARRLWQHEWRLVACLLAWLLVYGLFFFWWEPDNAEFWIASLPPAFVLVVLALRAAGPRWHAGVWLTLLLGLTMLLGNYNAVTQRGSGAFTPQFWIARALAEQSAPDDLLLVPDGLQKLYLNYYATRENTLSLSLVLQEQGGDWDAACRVVRGRIEAALASGVAVVVGEQVLQPALIDTRFGDPLVERFDLAQPAVDACFAPYRPALEPLALELGDRPGAGVGYYRLPAAQEKLAGAGWDFARAPWGWQADNLLYATFAGAAAQRGGERDVGGWSFVPLPDPHLTSPTLQIDTSRYWAVQVRLAKGVSNREGELYLLNAEGLIEPEAVVRWQLAGHSDPKTYHLDMRGHPHWQGVIGGLRLDPTTGPDHDPGERIEVLWLRLLSYADEPPDEPRER